MRLGVSSCGQDLSYGHPHGRHSGSGRGWTQKRPRPNAIGEMILKGLGLSGNCLD